MDRVRHDADRRVLSLAGQPADMVQALLDLDPEPAGIDPIDGAERSYRWEVTASQVGVIDDYEDAPTVVDVAVDDQQRVVQVQVRVSRLRESLPGGSTTFDFTYEDVPPITVPADTVPEAPVP